MKLKTISLGLVLGLSVWTPSIATAASHTWSGAVNGYFSNAGNWSAGGVPTLAETNTITFPSSATRFTVTNDIGALKFFSITFSGTNYIVRGASTLAFQSSLININCNGNSNNIESAMSFVSVASVVVGAGHSLILSGAVSGTNGLVKNGDGNLYLKGAASNPLSGDFFVNAGDVFFQKSGLASSYSGNYIRIGSTSGDLIHLNLMANDQIPDGATLDFLPSGVLELNGFSDVVGDVTMLSGIINGVGGGKLYLAGDLTLMQRAVSTNEFGFVTYESPTLWCPIEFNGTSRNINVPSGTVPLGANIVETGSITTINKIGAGALNLTSSNSFTGQFNVLQGTVFAVDVYSLGAVAGSTVVSNGASLKIPAGITLSEPLVLSGSGDQGAGALLLDVGGNSICSGLVTCSNLARVYVPAAQQLQFTGVVGGPGGVEKIGTGDLAISGVSANTITGASSVKEGRVLLNKPSNTKAIASVTITNGAQLVLNNSEQIDNAGVLSIYSLGRFSMTNLNETIGGLNLGGGCTVNTGSGVLTVMGDLYSGPPYDTTNDHAGVIRGKLSLGGGLRKMSSGFGWNFDSKLLLDCEVMDGTGTGGIMTSGGYVYLLRSNSFSGPVYLDSGFCGVSNTFALGKTNAGVFSTNIFTTAALLLLGPALTISGEVFSNSAGGGFHFEGTNTWSGPIIDNRYGLSCTGETPDAQLTLDTVLDGQGGVGVGGGKLVLAKANTYNGWTEVDQGTLIVRHPQSLGSTTNGTTVYGGGTLQLELTNGASISGEALWTGSGQWFLGYDTNAVLNVAGGVTNIWAGPITNYYMLSLAAGEYPDTLLVNTSIQGGGSLTFGGGGTVYLQGTGSNNITKITTEGWGYFYLNQTNGLAVPSGIVQANGGWLGVMPNQLPPFSTLDLGYWGAVNLLATQQVSLAKLSGDGTLYLGYSQLTISNGFGQDSFYHGSIYGYSSGNTTNLIKQGASDLWLMGPSFSLWQNGYTVFNANYLYGNVQLQGGSLVMSNGYIGALDIAANTAVSVHAVPDYLGSMVGLSIGSLTGTGTLAIYDASVLQVGQANSTQSCVFAGSIYGSSPAIFMKSGMSQFTLNGNVAGFSGETIVDGGTLFVNSQLGGDVHVTNNWYSDTATLSGTGQVQNVVISGLNARISPGASTNIPSYGKLRVGSLTIVSNGYYTCEISGTNAGVNLDQIEASGPVTLGSGGFANVSAFDAGTTSNRYTIVKSPSIINGTFAGKPEGGYFFPAAGRMMTITYLTAGGKEITLVEQAGGNLGNFSISNIVQQVNGHITLTGKGNPSSIYFIEANTNLATQTWTTIGSVTGDWNGGISFTDTNAVSFKQRFYRIRLQ